VTTKKTTKKKTGKKKTTKKAAAKPKAPAKKKAPGKPKAAVAFREVQFAQDLVGRKVKMCPLSLKDEGSFDAKVVNVDINSGTYIMKVRGKQGTFVYPMDQAAIQVV
jgi:hypothetical protein